MSENNVPETETEYEVWQEGMVVALATSLDHARHYLAVYRQDGPADLVECIHTRRILEASHD